MLYLLVTLDLLFDDKETMIKQYKIGASSLTLSTDLAAEFPVYVYWPKDKKRLLYSKSIMQLLNHDLVKNHLQLCEYGLSFLLQSGVIPPPRSIYKEIYILGIGDTAKIHSVDGNIEVEFSHKFPFLAEKRLTDKETYPEIASILDMITQAVLQRVNPSKQTFLFHSAGKDSNSIALALSEAGWQDKVTFISHRSKGAADESEISKMISTKLGFKHQQLIEQDTLMREHKDTINNYFVNAPFPCVDNVTLAYPLYLLQLPDLQNSNLIDGGGNDSYMMSPPTKREQKFFALSRYSHYASDLRKYTHSESIFSLLLRTPCEWCGLSGFTYNDARKIFPEATNVYPHWKSESKSRSDLDYCDFKTSVQTPITASEVHIRKVRNFSDTINSNLVLPFANQRIAEYFSRIPEIHLISRKSHKNKLILREMLKERIGLDSDKIGKMPFSYDSFSLVSNNYEYFLSKIYECQYWSKGGLNKLLPRLKESMHFSGWRAIAASRLIYRLFLLSIWLNQNKYL